MWVGHGGILALGVEGGFRELPLPQWDWVGGLFSSLFSFIWVSFICLFLREGGFCELPLPSSFFWWVLLRGWAQEFVQFIFFLVVVDI